MSRSPMNRKQTFTPPRSLRPTNPTVTVVVPAFNEARNLELMLPALPPVHEVIVVDGGSNDDTAAMVARTMPSARLLQQTRRGKGNALACGFEAATGDIIVMFDADGSADPAEITPMIQTLLQGADYAKGSRSIAGGGSVDLTVARSLGNVGLTTLVNILFGTRFSDLCYGYNAFWRDILPVLDLPASRLPSEEMVWGDGFEIETVINCRVAQSKLAITEFPSFELARIHGASNLNAIRDGLRVLRTIMAERRRPTPRWANASRPSYDYTSKKTPSVQPSMTAGRSAAGPEFVPVAAKVGI